MLIILINSHFKVKAYQAAGDGLTIDGTYGGSATADEQGMLTKIKAVAAPTCS